MYLFLFRCDNQWRIQKIQKKGAESPTPEWKLHFSGHAAYSIEGVFVMQSKVKLTFQNILKIQEKKGGRGPSPKSAYDAEWPFDVGAWKGGLIWCEER